MTVSDNKPCNFPLLLVSEQHDYFTRSTSAQQLQIPHSRINIGKFCPTVIGKYYWNDLPLHILLLLLCARRLSNYCIIKYNYCITVQLMYYYCTTNVLKGGVKK